MKNLLEIYKSVMATAGLKADEDGFVSVQLAGTEKKPALVKGKRLVLPTDLQLSNADRTNRVVFHPLSESILRGESEVLTYFRETFNKRLNFIIGYTAISLLDLAVSTAEHSKLSPEQTEFLIRVREADGDTVGRIQKITEAMMLGDNTRAFAHIRVQKNGTIGSTKHRRVGLVYFPFYEEIKKVPAPKQPNEIYGVKLRKSDREVFTALMEYMIPGLENPSEWMFPSDSEIAPSLEALMKCIVAVGDPVNTVVELFKDYIPGSEDLEINGEWEEDFKDLNQLLPQIRLIPMQPGNEGRVAPQGQNVLTIEGSPVSTPATPAAPAAPRTLGQPAPEAPEVKRPAGGLASMAISDPAPAVVQPHPLAVQIPAYAQSPQPSWVQPPPAPSYPAPGYPVAPSIATPGYPQPYQNQNQQVQMVMTANGPVPMVVGPNGMLVQVQQPLGYSGQQPAAPLRHTARGLDFTSVVEANPSMLSMAQPAQSMAYGGGGAPNTPGWARPGGFGNI